MGIVEITAANIRWAAGLQALLDLLVFRVDLWNASNLKFGDEFLGELRIPLKVLRQSSCYEAW